MNELEKLFISMGVFSVETFHDANSVDHLKKLKIEADEAIEEPTDILEYSDCLLTLLAAAYKAGFTSKDLLDASNEKLEILKTRTWIKLTDGSYQHVK